MFPKLVLCAWLISSTSLSELHAQNPDPFFTRGDAYLLAGFAAGTVALAHADRSLARRLQEPGVQENGALRTGADFFKYVAHPGSEIIGVGLYGVGKLTKSIRMQKLGLHGLEAIVLASSATFAIKVAAGRARPFAGRGPSSFVFLRGFQADSFQSFPSGHTAAAFAAASAASAEASRWIDEENGSDALKVVIGTLMYSGATLVGVSRMYHDEHWASDVIVGAALGTISGIKTVKYAYRNPSNIVERTLIGMRVTSGPDGETVLALSFSF